MTNWSEPIIGTDTFPTLCNTLSGTGKPVSGEECRLSPNRSITHDIKDVPPVCVEVTLRYFGVKFGVLSREPGAYLEENNSLQWQPIKSTKRSLLRCVSDEYCDYLPADLSLGPESTDLRSRAVSWKEIIHGPWKATTSYCSLR